MTETKPNMPVEELKFDNKDVEENKGIACLSYIGILCLIPLLTKKDSKFAQANAKQGLALFIVDVIVAILMGIPVIGWLLGLAVFVVSLIAVVKTLSGQFWKIPGVYDLSKKLNF